MSIVFDYIRKYPHKTKHILGISHEQFQELIHSASKKHLEIQREKKTKKFGLILLVQDVKNYDRFLKKYVYVYFISDRYQHLKYAGMLFGVSKSKAHTTFHYWRKVLREILP